MNSLKPSLEAFQRSRVGLFVKKILDDQAPNLAALLAWGTLSALLPLLLGIVAVAGMILRDEQRLDHVYNTLLMLLPAGAAGPLGEVLDGVRRADAAPIGVISLLLLLFNGSSFFSNMASVFDQAYHVPSRNLFVERLVALGMVLITTLLLLVSTLAVGISSLVDSVPLGLPIGPPLARALGWSIPIVSTFLMFLLIYKILPNVPQGWRGVMPGTLFSTVLFFLILQVFPLYVVLFPPNQAYAVFGAFLVFTFWLYVLGFVFVLGAELNAFLLENAQLAEGEKRRERSHSASVAGRVVGFIVVLTLIGPGVALAEQPGPVGQAPGNWAVTLNPTSLYSGPSDNADLFGDIAALATLQVLGYDQDWAHVYNPRTHSDAYVPSELLGPTDPPSRYLVMPPPAFSDEFEARGVVTDEAPLAVYPTPASEAVEREMNPNTWLKLTGAVQGEDGSRWYRTTEGDYVPSDVVFVPNRTEDFSGRWLDVDLNSPTRVTAYEGDAAAHSFLAIKGTGSRPTPTGVFTILRRVANETMNSDTIGIPRFSPGGYYLTNVLFTQYFTPDGASLHYNYWSGSFGYAGSHGCLGLTYADSAFLWEWARVGTPLSIHY